MVVGEMLCPILPGSLHDLAPILIRKVSLNSVHMMCPAPLSRNVSRIEVQLSLPGPIQGYIHTPYAQPYLGCSIFLSCREIIKGLTANKRGSRDFQMARENLKSTFIISLNICIFK
jgi:hypothetical protein